MASSRGGSNRKFLGAGHARELRRRRRRKRLGMGKGCTSLSVVGSVEGLGPSPENFSNLCLEMARFPEYLRIVKG